MNLSKLRTKKSDLEIGIDIGFGALKMALLQINPQEQKLLAYKCEDISTLKEDEKDKFILQKTEDFIKTSGLMKSAIHLNLSMTNAVFAKTLKLPSMPEREIPNAAKWQIKDEITIKADDAELAWQYILAPEKTKKARMDIICVLAKKDFLNKYLEIFTRANIAISEITFSPFSMNAVLSEEEEWTVILDIGHKQSIFSFHFKGRLLFLRTIHVGADHFKTQSTTQADQVKLNAEHLCDEIVRSTKYCELEFTKQAINHIYLTGGGAKIEALPGILKEVSGLDVKILRFPRNIQVDEAIRKDFEARRDSLQMLPAIGAAVSSDAKINILPLEAKTAKMLLFEKIFLRLTGLTIALILLLSFSVILLNINVLNRRLNNINAESNFLKEAQVVNAEINDYNKVINYVRMAHIPPEWPLKFIASAIPQDMVLNSFVFNNKDKSVNITGIIYARSGSAEEIATGFIRKLKQIELFRDAKLVSMERSPSKNAFVFNMACKLER